MTPCNHAIIIKTFEYTLLEREHISRLWHQLFQSLGLKQLDTHYLRFFENIFNNNSFFFKVQFLTDWVMNQSGTNIIVIYNFIIVILITILSIKLVLLHYVWVLKI